MATYAARPAPQLRSRVRVGNRVLIPLGMLVLAGLAVAIRAPHLNVGFWIDEGLSVGIAHRPATDIPGILRQDGSPPLYYLVLHYWMRVFGTSEAATHALSLTCTVVAIPVAFWVGRRMFGDRTGWMAALLTATNPFLSQYAQETRMYTLIALLGFAAMGAWLLAMVAEPGPVQEAGAVRRAPTIAFAVLLALMLWTHNWALFFGAATGVAWLALLWLSEGAERARLLRTGLLGYGGAIVLFLPWIPTLLYQAGHTGAPWAKVPTLHQLASVPGNLLDQAPALILALIGGMGLLEILRRSDARWTPIGRAVGALVVVSVLTVVFAWLTSQVSPAWAGRYLAVAVPPLILLCAVGLAHAGRLGMVTVVVVAIMWGLNAPPREKSSVRSVAQLIAPSVRPGDLVVVTQPEAVSVVHYYLPDGLRWASLTGMVPDVGVTDWRNGVERLEATSPERDLKPLLDALPRGRRLVLVVPQVYDKGTWSAPWTALVRVRSEEWTQFMSNDARFQKVVVQPPSPVPRRANPVRATVFQKL